MVIGRNALMRMATIALTTTALRASASEAER
jgi:hypothetical protein